MNNKSYIIAGILIVAGVFMVPAQMHAADFFVPSNVEISGRDLLQGDTLVIKVKNETANIVGRLGNTKIRFFRSENNRDWIGIVGISVNRLPGNYRLLIKIPRKSSFDQTVTISKTNWPVTELEITSSLAERGYTAQKIVTTVQNDENKQINSVLTLVSPVNYVSGPFIYPMRSLYITGKFGDVRKSGQWSIQHMGVDLYGPVGTPVYAINNGKVVFVKAGLPDYGDTMIVDHGWGIYSLYLHLSTFNFKVGDMVYKNDIVGLSGDTGYVTAPHLHFGIKVRGSGVDPLKFIYATQKVW